MTKKLSPAQQRRLREAYIRMVNAALAQNREELARELADEYTRERDDLPRAA